MQVHVGCEFRYEVDQPAPTVWQVRPRLDGPPRLLTASWQSEPMLPPVTYTDGFGNLCDRLTLPTGHSRVTYDAYLEVPPTLDEADPEAPWVPVGELPPEALVYLLPSRFCLPELMRERAWDLFGSLPPGWQQVQGICDWVHANISFGYGSSTSICTAMDVLQRGSGVCRDFTHLGVTLCRALNIPARYVCGYLPDIGIVPPHTPMDFCAWFEAYLGERWYTFDPRNNSRRVGRVVIGRGRDAIDVAMVTAYGLVTLKDMTVWADEVPEG